MFLYQLAKKLEDLFISIQIQILLNVYFAVPTLNLASKTEGVIACLATLMIHKEIACKTVTFAEKDRSSSTANAISLPTKL